MIDLDKKMRAQSECGIAVVPFTIFGFPNIDESIRALEILKNLNVFAYETAIPVAKGWSSETNSTIRNACKIALENHVTVEGVVKAYEEYRPNLYILYKRAFGMDIEKALKKFRGRIDMILPEWGVKNPEFTASICQKHGVSFVDAVSPLMPWKEIERRVMSSSAIVYLTCASRTGGSLFETSTIRSAIEGIKTVRPKVHVFCGFGIRTPNDVQTVGSIEGCDGVIIGSALLECLGRGLDSFRTYVGKIVIAAEKAIKKA
jgi:tryptophan synthase alpha subunit